MDYDDAAISDALHHLERRGLTRLASGAGSRAAKYRHLLADALPMDGGEQAVICVLMLRGPQTPGELKQRAERMHPFAELQAVHETLEPADRARPRGAPGAPPGQKEERYASCCRPSERLRDAPSGALVRRPPATSAAADEHDLRRPRGAHLNARSPSCARPSAFKMAGAG